MALVLAVALTCLVAGGSDGLSMDRLGNVSVALSHELWRRFNSSRGAVYSQLESDLANESVWRPNVTAIAQDVADSVSESLTTIRAALLKTAEMAESLYSKHQNQNCCSSVCQYGTGYDAGLCSMSCNGSSIQYISSGRQLGIEPGENGTKQCVMGVWEQDSCLGVEGMLDSAVHIPRDMHSDDPDVLCFVQWTDQLTEQFSNNSLSLNSTVVQYVGTSTRLLRFSPSSDWSSLSQCDRCPLTLQDTFELGRRPWYTNTVAGSKYVFILLDVSGSMAGFQSILARTTITELLKALTPNDYFQIMQVGEEERTGHLDCFTGKTRATPENVLVMSQVTLSLDDTSNVGRAHFSDPLRNALQLLSNATECHRVLIIFTDGESETKLADDIITENNAQREVQVFTFLMGYGNDNANLKSVACQNRGRMGRIREYSDVIPAVLLVTDTLKFNQPSTSDDVHYTVYRSIHGHIALTMGRSLWSNATAGAVREPFGIVGFDISHERLLSSALQQHTTGASGYGFIVDNNGQLLNHPSISQEYIQSLSDDNLLSLDVDLYEHAVDSRQWEAVREGMLGGGRGQHSLVTWSTLDREESYVLRNTTYSYAPIDNTPYVVVLVTPADLLVVAPPTELSNFTEFSMIGGCGQCDGLRRLEGRPHTLTHLTVIAGGCGNMSATLMRTLAPSGDVIVGVVRTALAVDSILSDVLIEGEEGGGEGGGGGGAEGEGGGERGGGGGGEVYLLDESASIVAAYPHGQLGWFPALYPAVQADLVEKEIFISDSIHGYELRSSQYGEEGGCECENLVLEVSELEVYQLRRDWTEVKGQLKTNDTLNLQYVALGVPNTSLLLIALSASCNRTECAQRPSRSRCVPCVCDCESCDKYRKSHHTCPTNGTYDTFYKCGTFRTHPSLVVVIATGILVTLIINDITFYFLSNNFYTN